MERVKVYYHHRVTRTNCVTPFSPIYFSVLSIALRHAHSEDFLPVSHRFDQAPSR